MGRFSIARDVWARLRPRRLRATLRGRRPAAAPPRRDPLAALRPSAHWQWRYHMAERIAARLDEARFGVVACYLIGSTKNADAGAGSDIDLVIHVRDTAAQRRRLHAYLWSWSRGLGLINRLVTGARTPTLLDVHLITDEDIAARTSFAVKIGAVTDGAHELPLGTVRK